MCTLSWIDHAAGYTLFFNRDESRTRKPGLPPAVRQRGAMRFLAPLDGDCGGTWIAVNERGACFCLLNGSTADAPPPGCSSSSRGEIPLALIEAAKPAEAAEALHALALDAFRPFELVMFAPRAEGLVGRWSGRALELELGLPGVQPLVSSSFCSEEVRRSRAAVFARRAASGRPADPALHRDYHRCHEPERGPRSPCMHRDDAETVSFSQVEVGERLIRFHYVPGAPCAGGRPWTVELGRR